MGYLQVGVRTSLVMHGYDQDNQEIVEHVNEQDFVKKLILIDRIQSISEEFILVTSSHGRVMYWQYDLSFDELKAKLSQAGVLLI